MAAWTPQRLFELFQHLGERRRHPGNQLPGGEQPMLAIARALVANPKPPVLDDATEGPAPLSRAEIRRVLATLREAGHAMLVIDKCVQRLIRLADRQVLIEKGCVVRSSSSASPDADRGVRHCHIGP